MQENIMQDIQDMIGNLLANAMGKMQTDDSAKQLGGEAGTAELPQMNIDEIKNFVQVMQKFIDNVNVMINRLETGDPQFGETEDAFLEGYMTTADNVLEIAAFSMKDKLTGLSNRYGFDNRLLLEWNRAARDKSYLSLVVFNVSDLEEQTGAERDDMRVKIAKTLEGAIKRSTDFIARWADDEFSILLPITNKDGAAIVTDRIRGVFNAISTNVCIGVNVALPKPGEPPAAFIEQAHNAYLAAKKAGANSIIFAE